MKLGYLEYYKKLLCEAMSWADLLKSTERYKKGGGGAGRIERAGTVRVKSRPVSVDDGRESWNFSYKSNPSTTGNRWHGFIQFLKGDMNDGDNAQELECLVNCDCPDYKYVWAYSNKENDAGFTGQPYNDNNGRPWLASSLPSPEHPTDRRTNPNKIPGLCKHLIALAGYLETAVDNTQNRPTDPSTGASLPPTDLYERLVGYGKSHPEFEIPYYDEVDESVNENYFRKSRGWMMHEGHSHVTTVFEDNSKLQFEVDFHENRGLDKDRWRKKAANTWRRLAKEVHDDIKITEVGNRIQKSWAECFKEAMTMDEMKQFVKPEGKTHVFDDAGYPKEVQGKPMPCVDPVNFTPRG